VLLVGALFACATPGGGGGFESEPPASPERIDACAGALIALRGASWDLRAELDETKARKLVWQGHPGLPFGGSSHQVDWNPALEYLAHVLDEVDAWLSAALKAAATVHAAPSTRDQVALTAAVARSGEALRLLGVYFAGIRAAQFALHDAPRYAVGGLGFNDGIIERVERLHGLLEAVRAGRPSPIEGDAAIDATTSYIDSYFRGLQGGAELMQAAKVVSVVNGAAGTVKAMAGLAELLAGASVEAGGLSYALAGAGSAATAPAAVGMNIAGIQAVVAGVAVTTAFLNGGQQPNDVGKDGERRAGFTGPKQRIPSLTGTARYRVPDGLTKVTIEEIKNAAKVSNTNQLRDFLAYARTTGRTFTLWVRTNTTFDSQLQQLIADEFIQVKPVL
jgi:restriction endonuclease fold toxin 7 of polymorphic toxin system